MCVSFKKNSFINVLAWAIISLYIFLFGFASYLKYQLFGYKDFDLAVHAQTLWNILHGSIYSSILGIGFLGNHANLILFLIAPLYLLFPHPLTLLFLQTFFLALAGYPIYRIAREELGEGLGIAVLFAYLMYPALGHMNLFEFHPTVFATAFLSFMFYYFKKENFRLFCLFLFLSLLCQENLPLITVPFGIYALFVKRNKAWAILPIVSGIIWFWVMVGKIIPYFNKDTVRFLCLYEYLGNSITEIVAFIIKNPHKVIFIINTRKNILYLFNIFMPASFFSLLSPSVIIVFPTFMQHLLSSRPQEHTIYYHYNAEIIPFIFISAIYGIRRFLRISYVKTHIRGGVLAALIIIVAVTANLYLGPHIGMALSIGQFKKNIWVCQKDGFLRLIPKDAGVVATFEFLPKLSSRRNLYSFHHVVSGFHTLSNKPYHLSGLAEYALVDFNDFLTFYTPGISDTNLINFIDNGKWGVIDKAGSIVLLKKNQPSKISLYKLLDAPPIVSILTTAIVNGEFELIGYDINRGDMKREAVNLTLFWKATKDVRGAYGSFIEIADASGIIKYRYIKPMCYNIYPTYRWRRGDIIKEDYTLLLPADVTKAHTVKMSFFNYDTGRTINAVSTIPRIIDESGKINLAGV